MAIDFDPPSRVIGDSSIKNLIFTQQKISLKTIKRNLCNRSRIILEHIERVFQFCG